MTLSIGSSGSSVRQLQQRLKAAGFNPGGVDGKYGQRTEQAVRAFQRSRRLEVDGLAGTQTMRALQRDSFQPSNRTGRTSTRANETRATETAPTSSRSGANRTATFDQVTNRGARNQMVTGRVTVNGHTYTFRSGGHGRGSLPAGNYEIRPHLWSRNDRSMSVGGVGYSFAMSDKYDSRVGGTRSLLRIHPDGRSPGTEG